MLRASRHLLAAALCALPALAFASGPLGELAPDSASAKRAAASVATPQAGAPAPAAAPQAGARRYNLWLVSGMLSKHINPDRPFNELNWGAGLRVEQDPSRGPWGAEIGYYKNSLWLNSVYLAATYRPGFLTWVGDDKSIGLGVAGGILSGYAESCQACVVGFAAPTLSAQWGPVALDALWFPPLRGITPQVFAIRARVRLKS